MVSVFEGQLMRTWSYSLSDNASSVLSPCEEKKRPKKHVINLYHDTITGVRSAMLNFEEIPNSLGNSSLLMESAGHKIPFIVENLPGYVEVKRVGWTSFSYFCFVDNKIVQESTGHLEQNLKEVFKVTLDGSTTTPDRAGENITWYVLKCVRLEDSVTNTVHRRFRDFSELNSQVKQNFKGHHLRSSLPPFPEKHSKLTTNHGNQAFLIDRYTKLEMFIRSLVDVPHVSSMICTKAFLGLLDRVREMSLIFPTQTLGITLVPYGSGKNNDSNKTKNTNNDSNNNSMNNSMDNSNNSMEERMRNEGNEKRRGNSDNSNSNSNSNDDLNIIVFNSSEKNSDTQNNNYNNNNNSNYNSNNNSNNSSSYNNNNNNINNNNNNDNNKNTESASKNTKSTQSSRAPAVVSLISNKQIEGQLKIGDAVSRINGVSVSELNFTGLVSRIQYVQRPVIIHFVQLVNNRVNTSGKSVLKTPDKIIPDIPGTSDVNMPGIPEVVPGRSEFFTVESFMEGLDVKEKNGGKIENENEKGLMNMKINDGEGVENSGEKSKEEKLRNALKGGYVATSMTQAVRRTDTLNSASAENNINFDIYETSKLKEKIKLEQNLKKEKDEIEKREKLSAKMKLFENDDGDVGQITNNNISNNNDKKKIDINVASKNISETPTKNLIPNTPPNLKNESVQNLEKKFDNIFENEKRNNIYEDIDDEFLNNDNDVIDDNNVDNIKFDSNTKDIIMSIQNNLKNDNDDDIFNEIFSSSLNHDTNDKNESVTKSNNVTIFDNNDNINDDNIEDEEFPEICLGEDDSDLKIVNEESV